MSLAESDVGAYIGGMENAQVVVNPLLPFQIVSAVMISALILVLISKGINIHRNNSGWRSAFGAAMFIVGFMAATVMVLASPMGFPPAFLSP